MPGGLRLSGLSEQRLFASAVLRRAERYERFGDWLRAGRTLATLAVLALYARRGGRFARESAAGPIGTAMLLAMLGFALVWLVSVPFALLSLWWERRYQQSRESYGAVVLGGWLGLGAELAFLSFAVLVVVGLARLLPRTWWLPAAAVFVGLAALYTFVCPSLVRDVHAPRDPRLRAAAARIAAREGVGGVPVRVERVDEPALRTRDPDLRSFFNTNTPEDLARARELAKAD